MKKLFWFFVPIATIFATIGIAGSSAKTGYVLPVGGGGETCAVDYVKMDTLENTTHPGELGSESFIQCNAGAKIQGTSGLLDQWPWGWIYVNLTTFTKTTGPGALGNSMTVWYSCAGGKSSFPTQPYKAVAAWYVTFKDGFTINMAQTQTFSPVIFSRCISPQLAQAG